MFKLNHNYEFNGLVKRAFDMRDPNPEAEIVILHCRHTVDMAGSSEHFLSSIYFCIACGDIVCLDCYSLHYLCIDCDQLICIVIE